ncbi:MYND-type zinc finger protein MUB1 [Dothidotthia symphoricarpi CBS 119687]|uniref:MYND-type zinc finger protein samB n=1 Tax=Dothidotthia symphoricarpi CBS 119687 TaxID=1392245 RepID=A0A6A6A482_9PLEO|nr:MYND-type zinc finger protein MUB1 [Dothidotthia symphoricarpi CBS 119687]KAF2126356.1 MYND-type zinc finger protein MUB1 [Dothidotthia symphoricarpi CBS 119687]
MREVNFSIPNANKASVGITTALYDRRALDCTSTLPLINSLNHLAYLTTSSARIRDILTVDGGIERLICILKQGRSKDMMDMWKWNLAFQCIFNIGVRGSENVRTRVVEADMVPVIATILDSYIKVVDKCRARAEADMNRSARLPSSTRHHSSSSAPHRTDRSRRPVPPPIDIPHISAPMDTQMRDASPAPAFVLSSPPERTVFTRTRPPHHHHHRSHEGRAQLFGGAVANTTRNHGQPLVTALPSMDATNDAFALRPVRDADRLPSMLPALQGEITSQPESPTTPSALPANQTSPRTALNRTRRRPSIRHQLSASGESDLDAQQDDIPVSAPVVAGAAVNEPIVGIQNSEINLSDIVDNTEMLDAGATPVPLAPSEGTDENNETFNITHRPALDGSLINPTNTPPNATITGFSPLQPTINVPNTNPPPPWYPRYAQDRQATAGALAAMPRDEDVLMSLQLLAYVSKYCNLRSYFQQSHLVPKLQIGTDLQLLDGEATSPDTATVTGEEEELEEYELPDDFNIFPLVEQFTVRHHTADMQYWASVVMRNLCRKDDSRGGIRQCAYYQCGRWEEYTRQFAKCRRCRRTKYCSKECQKSAWVFHRHWCVAAN